MPWMTIRTSHRGGEGCRRGSAARDTPHHNAFSGLVSRARRARAQKLGRFERTGAKTYDSWSESSDASSSVVLCELAPSLPVVSRLTALLPRGDSSLPASLAVDCFLRRRWLIALGSSLPKPLLSMPAMWLSRRNVEMCQHWAVPWLCFCAPPTMFLAAAAFVAS
jgi:hypothetical protein